MQTKKKNLLTCNHCTNLVPDNSKINFSSSYVTVNPFRVGHLPILSVLSNALS